MNHIPYGKQDISADDIAAVVEVLQSDFITQGPKVPEFESAIALQCKRKDIADQSFEPPHAVATNSATSALHIACLALGVSHGDLVWTSPISFVASSNCALYCGANIDFVDIDLASGNLSASHLQTKLVQAKKDNTLPKVVIVVHLAGQSCDMREIKKLSDEYGFFVIEDASHAIGTSYNDDPIGCCKYSDITIFSFHPVKIITSAEGGMALTNNKDIAKKLRLFRSHGVTATPEDMTEPSHGPWYYQQIALGFNYRMTELQAALGISQTSRLHDFVSTRNKMALIYDQAFSQTALTPLTPAKSCYSAYHLYIVLLPEADSQKHKEVLVALRNAGIGAHVHYIPIHSQPYYQELGFKLGDFPNAEEYYQRAVSLPLYPDLSPNEQCYIIDTIKTLL